jgi:CRP-like cAMP-binding protein
MNIDIEKTLRIFTNTKFLRILDQVGRQKLMDAALQEEYKDQDVIMKEGDIGDAMYIIVDGIASVSVDNMGTPKAVAELTDGAFFGEMGVITDQPRSATVTANGPLQVLKIPKQAVVDIMNEYPKLKEIVAKIGLARTEDTFQKILED